MVGKGQSLSEMRRENGPSVRLRVCLGYIASIVVTPQLHYRKHMRYLRHLLCEPYTVPLFYYYNTRGATCAMTRFIPGRWDRLLLHLQDRNLQTNSLRRLDQVQVCPGCHCNVTNGTPDLDGLYERQLYRNLYFRTRVDWKYIARAGCLLCRILVDVASKSARFQKKRGVLSGFLELDKSRDQDNAGRFLLGLRGILHDRVWILFDEDASLGMKSVPYWEIPRYNTLSYSLGVARKWLSACEGHENCHTATTQSFSFTPRFIELGVETMRLVERDILQDGCQYVALSHCWGEIKPIQALTTNVDSLKEEILLPLLPKSFREAIAISRGLKYQYIWIDALCIIQDDELDWKQQSSQMDSVYTGAHLVLSAAAARDSSEGFLDQQRLFEEQSGTIRIDEGQRTIPYRLRFTGIHYLRDPIDERAWCFQERLCARRYLAFGRREMRWECNTTSRCECRWMSGQTLNSRPSSGILWDVRTLERVLMQDTPTRTTQTPSNTEQTARWPGTSTGRTEELMNLWMELILPAYTTRTLTLHSDRLVAISAVASQFQARTGDTYLAGLWKCDLVYQLLWQHISCIEWRRPRRCELAEDDIPNASPSWSWASVKGFISFPDRRNQGSIQEEIQIISAETVLSSPICCGAVSSGIIHLRGRLASCELLKKTIWTRSVKILGRYIKVPLLKSIPSYDPVIHINGEKLGDANFDNRPGPTGIEEFTLTPDDSLPILYMEKPLGLWILPVLTVGWAYEHKSWSLIVRSSASFTGCFERVGLMESDTLKHRETWGKILNDYQAQDIALV
ncbi:heterokaryon incompatibility protein-domain-containing protein [Xylariaceae sp. FL1272]|nr:heterokaryon incompatibility protein-domain-containing protein [Xylariaceae sp. FL1272]